MNKKFCNVCKKEVDMANDFFGIFINSQDNKYIPGQPYEDYSDFDFCSLECLKQFVDNLKREKRE